jgi:hypothetical protein
MRTHPSLSLSLSLSHTHTHTYIYIYAISDCLHARVKSFLFILHFQKKSVGMWDGEWFSVVIFKPI